VVPNGRLQIRVGPLCDLARRVKAQLVAKHVRELAQAEDPKERPQRHVDGEHVGVIPVTNILKGRPGDRPVTWSKIRVVGPLRNERSLAPALRSGRGGGLGLAFPRCVRYGAVEPSTVSCCGSSCRGILSEARRGAFTWFKRNCSS